MDQCPKLRSAPAYCGYARYAQNRVELIGWGAGWRTCTAAEPGCTRPHGRAPARRLVSARSLFRWGYQARRPAAADTATAALDLSAAATLAGDGVLARAADRLARWAGAAVAVTVPGLPTRGSLRDPSTQLRVRAAADRGRATAMLEMIEPELLPMRGLTLDALHLGRGERVRGASPARDAVAPFAAACGVGRAAE